MSLRWVAWIEIGKSFTLHAVGLRLGTFRAFVCAFAMKTHHRVEWSHLEVSIGPLAHRLDTHRLRNLTSRTISIYTFTQVIGGAEAQYVKRPCIVMNKPA